MTKVSSLKKGKQKSEGMKNVFLIFVSKRANAINAS